MGKCIFNAVNKRLNPSFYAKIYTIRRQMHVKDRKSAPIKLFSVIKKPRFPGRFCSGPCWDRTSDPLIMSQML